MWRIDTHLRKYFHECGGLRNCSKAYRWPYLSKGNTRRSSPCITDERLTLTLRFTATSEISYIRIDVWKMKCWMKQGVNRSNMKIALDEPENFEWKICSRANFHPTWFFTIKHNFFFFCYYCVLLNRSSISSNMAFLLCWMKCWIGLTRL